MPRHAAGVVLIVGGLLFAAGVLPVTPVILGIAIALVGAALIA